MAAFICNCPLICSVQNDLYLRQSKTIRIYNPVSYTHLDVYKRQINSSTALWELLNDETLPREIRQSAVNLRLTTSRAGMMADDLHTIIADMKAGKGSVGMLLKDTAFAYNPVSYTHLDVYKIQVLHVSGV